MLERLDSNKHSNLLGLFVSYDENEVLWMRSLFSQYQLYKKGCYKKRIKNQPYEVLWIRIHNNKFTSFLLASIKPRPIT
jgi:hypothetical protein